MDVMGMMLQSGFYFSHHSEGTSRVATYIDSYVLVLVVMSITFLSKKLSSTKSPA